MEHLSYNRYRQNNDVCAFFVNPALGQLFRPLWYWLLIIRCRRQLSTTIIVMISNTKIFQDVQWSNWEISAGIVGTLCNVPARGLAAHRCGCLSCFALKHYNTNYNDSNSQQYRFPLRRHSWRVLVVGGEWGRGLTLKRLNQYI